jgi:Mn2+/Fe2+ NRAMP family transporter
MRSPRRRLRRLDLRPDPILYWLQARAPTVVAVEALEDLADPEIRRPDLAEALREGPRGALRLLGPGITTGAADDDPSAIGTYAQAGAQAGYGLLWIGLFTLPLMISVQELAQRIALQTGAGLAANLRHKFPAWLVGAALAPLVVSNLAILGADLRAVATGVELLTLGSVKASWLIVPIAAALVGFQLLGRYRILFRTLRLLALVLFAYAGAALLVHAPPRAVLVATFVPHLQLSGQFMLTVAAVLGTTLSPYLFFWQPAEEIDRLRAQGMLTVADRAGAGAGQLRAARVDTAVGMLLSQLVAYCIMLTTATVLHGHAGAGIQTAGDAARGLEPIAGPVAFILFAAGFIGTGLLAIPVLSASTAYAINETARIPASLAARPRYQPTFYAIIVAATAMGVAMNLLRLNLIQALVLASALSAVAAVPLLVLMTLYGADRRHMGHRASGWLSQCLTWISAAAMAAATAGLAVLAIAAG